MTSAMRLYVLAAVALTGLSLSGSRAIATGHHVILRHQRG